MWRSGVHLTREFRNEASESAVNIEMVESLPV
jgi:hypothetical protein